MFKNALTALALAVASYGAAYAQVSWLDQEAHRPYQRQPGTDGKTPTGYTPQQMQHAYGVDQIANQGAGQIIGIVDGYDYPSVESDLGVFTTQFNLPACTIANGCLTVVYATGTKPPPNAGWSGETSLDVQWAHAIAPQAKILLVEAPNGSVKSLLEAVPVAVQNGATTVNMSWGTNNEPANEQSLDPLYFNNASVTYINASGDSGINLFGYPGASPLVVGAGGTTAKLDSSGNILSETAWSGSGGGESKYFPEPSYQIGAQSSGQRGVPDVAYNASPATGVPVYDSEAGNWAQVGGTSASSPQWCAIVAIANSIRAGMGKGTIGTDFLNVVYANPTAFHDITKGANGKCGTECEAGPGYDFVTGLGSPMAPQVVDALVAAP
ncbi:MAG: S53 family peptidase [Bryobacteraceae bacterium]|jgi:subtilase family serine protease